MKHATLCGLMAALLFPLANGCDSKPQGNADQADWPLLVRADGTYPTRALDKERVVVKVIQNRVRNLEDFADPAVGLKANLKAMESWISRACNEGKKPDFLLFNEFPLTGYSRKPREQKLRLTITVPGPETRRLGELARACDTYIIFGSYARDEEWPGHILSINSVINRKGEVAARFWKTRNIKRLVPDGEIPTTTIESVYDKYLARYGKEQLIPVLRTEYGNIAVSTVQLDPFVFAAFAMRGVEIMFRTATLFSIEDVRASARFNKMYSAMSNIIFPPDSPAASRGGNSLIVDPNGRVMAEAPGNRETIIETEIPIAEFRAQRRIPRYPLEMLAPLFAQYEGEIPLNHMDVPADQLPATRADMKAWLDAKSRWLNSP